MLQHIEYKREVEKRSNRRIGKLRENIGLASRLRKRESVIEIVWEFRVCPEKQEEFERHYRPKGTWAELFRNSPEFQGTMLLRDAENPGRYLTVDRWTSGHSFEDFKQQFGEEYRRIDDQMEVLTESETKLGVFEAV